MLDSKRIVYFLVGLGGAFVGILFSLITGCTLMEISFSPVFVVLMGLLFEAISVCFYYRIISIHVCIHTSYDAIEFVVLIMLFCDDDDYRKTMLISLQESLQLSVVRVYYYLEQFVYLLTETR